MTLNIQAMETYLHHKRARTLRQAICSIEKLGGTMTRKTNAVKSERILDVAEELARHGYDGVTMRQTTGAKVDIAWIPLRQKLDALRGV